MEKETHAPFVIPDAALTTAIVHVAFEGLTHSPIPFPALLNSVRAEVFVRSLQRLDDTSLCLAFERVVAVVRRLPSLGNQMLTVIRSGILMSVLCRLFKQRQDKQRREIP